MALGCAAVINRSVSTFFAAKYPVRGVDVSEYQGEIDWEKLALNEIEFAFIKATEGSAYADPRFQDNWAAAQKTPLAIGAYHFFSFDSSGRTQAANFIATAGNMPGALPPVIDVELYGKYKTTPPNPKDVKAELAEAIRIMEEYYGSPPILYVTQPAYNLYIAGDFPGCPIWIRNVFFAQGSLSGGRQWDFWQYSDKGRLEGYFGEEPRIDLNVFYGTPDQLRQLCME